MNMVVCGGAVCVCGGGGGAGAESYKVYTWMGNLNLPTQ